jgi:hypothetical protein
MKPGGFKLWVNCIQLVQPPTSRGFQRLPQLDQTLGVAVQVAPFEKQQILKPGDHFIGSRVETTRFQALWVNWIQQLYSPASYMNARWRSLAPGKPPLRSGTS